MNFTNINSENTEHAYSQIKDTDYAIEMIEFTKSNMLNNISNSLFIQGLYSKQNLFSYLINTSI